MAKRKKPRKARTKRQIQKPTTSSTISEIRDDRVAEIKHSFSSYTSTVSLRDYSGLYTPAVLVIVLVTIVCYFPAMLGGFVWDDSIFTEEPVIHRVSGLWDIWFSPRNIKNEGHYWPIVYTSFWVEHKLWGLAPVGYHIVNVLLHVVNTLLLLHLMLRLIVPGAWIIAAVFAVHPLHVESVAWIIERKDLLSALFYITAVLAWIRFVEEPRLERYVLAIVLFIAGMLSKSIVVTLPVALLILHWWKEGRVTLTDLLRLAPFFLVGLFIAGADVSFYRGWEDISFDYSLIERSLIAAHALWFYVWKILWPTNLAVIYPLWDIHTVDLMAWVYFSAAVALVALLWFGRHRVGRGPLAGVLFFAVTLSPLLGFVDYGYMQFSFVADRYQYLGGIGVLAVLIGTATDGASRLPRALNMCALGIAAIVLLFLGTLTWHQNGIYRDGVTFFSHIISLNSEARSAHLNLSRALVKAGRIEESLAASLIAVEQEPDSVKALSNLGVALLGLGRFDKAEKQLLRATKLDSRNIYALQNLAETFRKQGRFEEAFDSFRKITNIDPEFVLAYVGMGYALFGLKQNKEAVDVATKAISLNPAPSIASSVYLLKGRAFRKLDQFKEAEENLRQAIKIDPSNVEPLQELAETFRKQGRFEEAVDSFRKVTNIDPEFVLAYVGMGYALFGLKQNKEAVDVATKAISLNPAPSIASSVYLLKGRAFRKLDQFKEAEENLRQAIKIDPSNVEPLQELANLLIKQKRFEEANKYLARVKELNPDNKHTLLNFAESLRQQERYEEAFELYKEVIEIDSEFAIAHAGMGQVLFQMKQFDESVESLSHALSLEPNSSNSAALNLILGIAYHELGHIEKASEHYEIAIQIDSRQWEALDRLAILRIGQKRYENALGLYRNLLEIKPDNAKIFANIGVSLAYLKRYDEALQNFERALALDPTLKSAQNGIEQMRTVIQQNQQ